MEGRTRPGTRGPQEGWSVVTDDSVVEESTSTWFFVARDVVEVEPPYLWVGNLPHLTEEKAREAVGKMVESTGVDGYYPVKVTETRRIERV